MDGLFVRSNKLCSIAENCCQCHQCKVLFRSNRNPEAESIVIMNFYDYIVGRGWPLIYFGSFRIQIVKDRVLWETFLCRANWSTCLAVEKLAMGTEWCQPQSHTYVRVLLGTGQKGHNRQAEFAYYIAGLKKKQELFQDICWLKFSAAELTGRVCGDCSHTCRWFC